MNENGRVIADPAIRPNNYNKNPIFFAVPVLLQVFLEVAALAGFFSGAVESYPEVVVLTLLSLQAAGPLLGVVALMAEPLLEAVEPAAEPYLEVEPFPEAVEPAAESFPGAAAQAVPSSEAFESFPEAQLFHGAAALAEFLSEASETFLQAGPFPEAGRCLEILEQAAGPLLEAVEPRLNLSLGLLPSCTFIGGL
jgi:hypothetical protein